MKHCENHILRCNYTMFSGASWWDLGLHQRGNWWPSYNWRFETYTGLEVSVWCKIHSFGRKGHSYIPAFNSLYLKFKKVVCCWNFLSWSMFQDAIFQRLQEDKFFYSIPCIIITAKGYPDLASRCCFLLDSVFYSLFVTAT